MSCLISSFCLASTGLLRSSWIKRGHLSLIKSEWRNQRCLDNPSLHGKLPIKWLKWRSLRDLLCTNCVFFMRRTPNRICSIWPRCWRLHITARTDGGDAVTGVEDRYGGCEEDHTASRPRWFVSYSLDGKKGSPYWLLNVGFRSWSRFLAVSLQVMWVINPLVGCHYFPPGLQLPPQPLRGLLPILLLGGQRHNGCEQFA